MPEADCRRCGKTFERPARGRPRLDCYECQPRSRPSSGRTQPQRKGGQEPSSARDATEPARATGAGIPERERANQPVGVDTPGDADRPAPDIEFPLDLDQLDEHLVDEVIAVMEQQYAGPLGFTEPRLFTPPLRELTPETTLGYAFIEFCHEVLRESLLPWQCWLAVHALELAPGWTTSDPGWRFRFKVVLVIVARQNGKSDFSRRLKLFRLYVTGARLIIGTAQDLDVARSMLAKTNEMVDECPALADEKVSYITANGKERLALTEHREYVLKASNKKAGRGPSADHVDMDELREHRDFGAWGALSKTIRARPRGQLWGFSNAGDDDSVLLNKLQKGATERILGTVVAVAAVADAGDVDEDDDYATQTFMAEWSAPEGCELNDVEGVRQANPGLGYLFGIDSVWADLENDTPEVFRTEVLCQRVDQLDGAIDLAAWKECADAAGSLAGLRERLVLSVDAAPDGEHVTAAIAGELDDGRVRVEAVGAWSSIPEALAGLRRALPAIGPRAVNWFPSGPAAALGSDLRTLCAGLGIELDELTGSEVTEACQELAALVKGGRLLHSSDALFDAHVQNARKLRQGDGWRFTRGGAGHVDAAYAVAGAAHGARNLPEEVNNEPLMVVAW